MDHITVVFCFFFNGSDKSGTSDSEVLVADLALDWAEIHFRSSLRSTNTPKVLMTMMRCLAGEEGKMGKGALYL